MAPSLYGPSRSHFGATAIHVSSALKPFGIDSEILMRRIVFVVSLK